VSFGIHILATGGSGVAGAGVGTLVVWVFSLLGVELSPEGAAALAGIVASIFIFIARNGIIGIATMVWNGSSRYHKGDEKPPLD
jgi:putative flippase GtrA